MSAGQGGAASSFTDLMASLVAVFVLLFVVAQNNRGAGIDETRAILIKQLRGELQRAGIDSAAVDSVPNDPNTVVVIFPDSVLFERGKSEMSEGGRRVVRNSTPGLTRVMCVDSLRSRLDQVVVEGHTDNTVPFGMDRQTGRRFNLRLSQLRSMDYVATSTTALTTDDRALSCYLNLVSASGRGQEDSIPGLAADAAGQRRVVLRIRLRTEVRDTLRVPPATQR